MSTSLPNVHLLTCPPRAEMCLATLARWARTDWSGRPQVHVDGRPEEPDVAWGSTGRVHRAVAAYAGMMRRALEEPGADSEWLLFLEDDLDFHPRLATHLRQWKPLADPSCSLASLFNPSFRANPHHPRQPQAFAAAAEFFLGAQALLLRRVAVRQALAGWEDVPGTTSQRLARLLAAWQPIWVHSPSLVQHVAEDSSWGARVQKALDFDPNW